MDRRFILPLAAMATLLALTTASEASRPTKRLSDEARGQELYDRHCIQCHGENAGGDGPLTATLVKPVPDLRPAVTEANRDAHVVVVLDGKKTMPSFRNTFDRFEAERVMRHMQLIAQPGYERPSAVTPKPAAKTPPAPPAPAPSPAAATAGGPPIPPPAPPPAPEPPPAPAAP